MLSRSTISQPVRCIAPNPAPLAPHQRPAAAPTPQRAFVRPLAPLCPTLAALRLPVVHATGSQGESDSSFSRDLFMQTMAGHQAINKHAAVAGLRAPETSGPIYARMLVDKLAFHTTLEELLQAHRHEALLSLFDTPVLRRQTRLRQDLRALRSKLPSLHSTSITPSEAARSYVRHLQAMAIYDPRALAAHAWLHYLGDMHGGQLMSGVLGERYGHDTVRSFDFDVPVTELRELYGRALDIPMSHYEQRLLRQEAPEVYAASLRMYDAWVQP